VIQFTAYNSPNYIWRSLRQHTALAKIPCWINRNSRKWVWKERKGNEEKYRKGPRLLYNFLDFDTGAHKTSFIFRFPSSLLSQFLFIFCMFYVRTIARIMITTHYLVMFLLVILQNRTQSTGKEINERRNEAMNIYMHYSVGTW